MDDTQGKERFWGECTNKHFYPDCIEVLCDDPVDERSCKALTPRRDFPYLEQFKAKN